MFELRKSSKVLYEQQSLKPRRAGWRGREGEGKEGRGEGGYVDTLGLGWESEET